VNTHKDFEEFIQLLAENKVEFVIVGGYAVVFHGFIRSTQDIDILYRPTARNAKKIRTALAAFGLPVSVKDCKAFLEPGTIFRMGIPPERIKLINNVSGLDFEEIWRKKTAGAYGKAPVNYISKPHLIINKKASGRPKDLMDVEELIKD
jgi:hypothetical protein